MGLMFRRSFDPITTIYFHCAYGVEIRIIFRYGVKYGSTKLSLDGIS